MRNGDRTVHGRRVTRDVSLAAVGDLLQSPPRGTVAFTHDGAVDVLPARARCGPDTYAFGVARDAAVDLEHREVVLVIDAGSSSWFELRGLSVRGIAVRIEPPTSERFGLTWYAIEPRRVLAWDYGALREE